MPAPNKALERYKGDVSLRPEFTIGLSPGRYVLSGKSRVLRGDEAAALAQRLPYQRTCGEQKSTGALCGTSLPAWGLGPEPSREGLVANRHSPRHMIEFIGRTGTEHPPSSKT